MLGVVQREEDAVECFHRMRVACTNLFALFSSRPIFHDSEQHALLHGEERTITATTRNKHKQLIIINDGCRGASDTQPDYTKGDPHTLLIYIYIYIYIKVAFLFHCFVIRQNKQQPYTQSLHSQASQKAHSTSSRMHWTLPSV